MAKRPKPAERIAVRKGQIYRVPRNGAPAHHVKIAGVSKGATPDGSQPIATYFPVTRFGVRKGRHRLVVTRNLDGTVQTRPNVIPHWLTWDKGRTAWVMGAPFELVEA